MFARLDALALFAPVVPFAGGLLGQAVTADPNWKDLGLGGAVLAGMVAAASWAYKLNRDNHAERKEDREAHARQMEEQREATARFVRDLRDQYAADAKEKDQLIVGLIADYRASLADLIVVHRQSNTVMGQLSRHLDQLESRRGT